MGSALVNQIPILWWEGSERDLERCYVEQSAACQFPIIFDGVFAEGTTGRVHGLDLVCLSSGFGRCICHLLFRFLKVKLCVCIASIVLSLLVIVQTSNS